MAAPLYVSEAQIAAMLGHRIDWLRQNATMLERQYGFPPIDPVIGKRHREAVEAWARERNTRRPAPQRSTNKNQENTDAF